MGWTFALTPVSLHLLHKATEKLCETAGDTYNQI